MSNCKIVYPSTGEFKLADVMKLNEGKLIKEKPISNARVALQIRDDVEDGILSFVRREESNGKRGKPSSIYIKNKTQIAVPLSPQYSNICIPKGNFTIKQLSASNGNLKSSIANHFVKMMSRKKMIFPISKQKSETGRGKPATVYCSKDGKNNVVA